MFVIADWFPGTLQYQLYEGLDNSQYSDLLQAEWFGVWTLLGASDFLFSTSVQTVPGAHPSSHTKGTWGSFPGVKQPGRGINHLPSFNAKVKND